MRDLAVVGSGIGGLAAALIAQSHGVRVTLFEAHATPGGSAGYFKRGPFVFDAGATTLSGLGPERPFGKFLQRLGIEVPVYDANPGIVYHLGRESFRHFREPKGWAQELRRTFPGQNHERFFQHVEELAQKAWVFLPELQRFPPQSWQDLRALPHWLKGTKLAPYMLMSLRQLMQLHFAPTEKFLSWVNALCLISAQNHCQQVPALIGALALTYPQETWAPQGGMKGLFDQLVNAFVERGGVYHPRTLVTKVSATPSGASVVLESGESHFDASVLNLTDWALERWGLRPKRAAPAWAALSAYLAVRSEAPIQELYHLVIDEAELGDYFVSFSHPTDRSRAPEGWQTLTLSQHALAEDWEQLSPAEYQRKKEERLAKLLAAVKSRFPQIRETKFATLGTPRTFAHYTQRPRGLVGGRPHLWSFPAWRWSGPRVSDNIFQVGDTVFPGQGLVGVVTGVQLWEKLVFREPNLQGRGRA